MDDEDLKNKLIIDVREAPEFASQEDGHLIGAKNSPLTKLEESLK